MLHFCENTVEEDVFCDMLKKDFILLYETAAMVAADALARIGRMDEAVPVLEGIMKMKDPFGKQAENVLYLIGKVERVQK